MAATRLSGPLFVSGVYTAPPRPFGDARGKTLFVDASRGQAGASGLDIEHPLDTITEALGKATSGAGDTIFVFPGTYDEAVTITKDYVRLVGVRSGYGRPDVAPSSGTSRPLFVDNAQGVVIEYMRFVPDGLALDTARIEGNGYLVYDCVFDGDPAQAGTNALLVLQGDANDDSFTASEGKIYSNLFRGSSAFAETDGVNIGIDIRHAPVPSGVGVSDVEIVGNRFYGNLVDLKSTAAASGGGAGIYRNFLIANNWFLHSSGAAYVYADLDQADAAGATTDSALISGNYFADEALVAGQFDIATRPNVIFVGNYDAAGLVNGSAFN